MAIFIFFPFNIVLFILVRIFVIQKIGIRHAAL